MRDRAYRYTVIFEPDPEGGYTASVPAIPEICTQGDTLEEARAMARDAILCVIESMLKNGEPIPTEPGSPPVIEKIEVTPAA